MFANRFAEALFAVVTSPYYKSVSWRGRATIEGVDAHIVAINVAVFREFRRRRPRFSLA